LEPFTVFQGLPTRPQLVFGVIDPEQDGVPEDEEFRRDCIVADVRLAVVEDLVDGVWVTTRIRLTEERLDCRFLIMDRLTIVGYHADCCMKQLRWDGPSYVLPGDNQFDIVFGETPNGGGFCRSSIHDLHEDRQRGFCGSRPIGGARIRGGYTVVPVGR
jgi:hypothetical protein